MISYVILSLLSLSKIESCDAVALKSVIVVLVVT
jgi:hypothetical protein